MRSPAQPRPWVVFADDWGRHPSSCQHIVRHVLPHREVVWVNTIGTRPPRLDWSTATRAAGKLRSWMDRSDANEASTEVARAGTPVPRSAPRVVSPKMWPSFNSSFGRQLNRKLLLRALTPVTRGLSQLPVVVTTLPLVADLVGELPAFRWVYYCVDDFSDWPGYDGSTMLAMERELVPKVDDAIVVSETLQRHVGELGVASLLITHGVDLDHWRAVSKGGPPEFAGLAGPIVLFWGVIDRRTDTDFVRRLSSILTEGTIVLVGPSEDPDPELLQLPRVVTRPAVPYARLPQLAAAADVLVMPYVDAPVTRAMQPLKLKEYLATSKPAVVRSLPATREWADCADLVGTADQFAQAVITRIANGLPPEQGAARQRLAAEGWAGKAEQFERRLDDAEPLSE